MTDVEPQDEEDEQQVTDISISFHARTKARYFSEPELRRHIIEEDGTLFWDPIQEVYQLRTNRMTTHRGRISIQFVVEGETLSVINQTSDHYDWSVMELVEYPEISEDFQA